VNPDYVIDLDDARAVRPDVAGGKGASLARLLQAGFPVPGGVVVTADAWRAFAGGDPAAGARLSFGKPAALRAECAGIRARLEARPLPAPVREAILARLPALPVAVRSSSTVEDLAGAACAGQHDTFLMVDGAEAVLDAVRRCFVSLFEDRAVRYRHERGLGQDAPMAVVVQRMVPAEVAGVAFCLHPVTGDLGRIVVNAAPGLGDRVVSGEGDVDQFVIDKATGAIVERAGAAGSAPPLEELRSLCARVERFHAFPQDIEWACSDGVLHLLQSRPVTRFPARWTRAESAERYPYPITPLTWDFTVEGFHESLAHSLRLIGMPPFEGRWFERFDGYVYGNETAVRLFTAGHQAAFDDLDGLRAVVPVLRERYGWVQQLPVTWTRDLDAYLLDIGELRAVPLRDLPLAALWRHVERIDALGRAYFLPNIAISIMQGMLHDALARLVALVAPRGEADALRDALACFCETKTGLVNRDLHELALAAGADAALAAALLGGDPRAVDLDAHPGFAERFRAFLARHGHREVDFDPYHPTWSGQPWVVLANVKAMLARGELPDPTVQEHALRVRQREAEERFLALVPEDLRYFASELLRLARAYTALDDLEHYQTTRLHPLFRAAVVEAGRRIGLDPPDDAFFLSREELRRGLLEGAEVRAAARSAKASYARQSRSDPPFALGEEAGAPPAPGALIGLPGSPGIAEGVVRHVLTVDDFADFPSGAVLVARTTNPAWTPLFYGAAAVVTESGGPLSHGAVTAREIGLPAVMALRGALALLPDGARARVNGAAGTVELL